MVNRVLLRKLGRDLRARWGPLLVLVLIVAVGVGCFVGMASVYRDMESARAVYYREQRLADFTVELKRTPRWTVAVVEKLPNVLSARGRDEPLPDLAAATECDDPDPLFAQCSEVGLCAASRKRAHQNQENGDSDVHVRSRLTSCVGDHAHQAILATRWLDALFPRHQCCLPRLVIDPHQKVPPWRRWWLSLIEDRPGVALPRHVVTATCHVVVPEVD